MEAKSLWHIDPTQSEIRKEILPEIKEGELRIKTIYSLVSQGTETLVALGKVPTILWKDMTVPYMKGSFSFPVAYGYSVVGRVEEGAEEWLGKVIHCMHPHQDYFIINKNDVHFLPDSVSPLKATLASNLETAVNAVWDAQVQIGDRILLFGFGLIGALTALVLKEIPGVKIQVVEINEQRKAKAISLGFDCENIPDKNKYDICFNTTGNEKALQQAIESAGKEGKIVEMSWYGNKAVSLNLGHSFHSHRKQIICSQVSKIPSVKSARWDYKRRKDLVFDILKSESFDMLIESVTLFNATPLLFQNLRENKKTSICKIIKY